ncbi:hypothetical protein [Pisciglobus halotolerans]|uniref:Uncharacterized protein n=1 Tax=Pisciglobus halotolerans TaxID=745365 RepID=A0A1I3AZU1_9LACT|nr:hypothetical protein [Pisciglobus halotolerans]SFH55219.1 hypothetical protein SAMN04489868_102137 [Pisciglobus halotolerans]
MQIKEVLCTSNKQVMNVKEVAEHKNHVQIKQHLQCNTPGCEAKISFVSGSSGKHDHFRTVKYSDHSESCYIYRSKEELKERIKMNEKIAVSLDKKDVKRRIMYFFKKRTDKAVNGKPFKSSPIKRKNGNTKAILGKAAVLGGKDAPTLEEAKGSNRVYGPRIQPLELNQISEAEEGKLFQLSALIEKVRKTKNGFELDIYMGSTEAILVINEAFIKGSKDQQIHDYFTSLIKFTDVKEQYDFKVTIYAFCMFETYNKNETIIFADNFDTFFVSVSGKYIKPIKLDAFQAMFIRETWKKNN